MKKILLILAAAMVFLSGCSLTGDGLTDPSMQTLRYEGGFAEGSKFHSCVKPGSKMISDDTYYPYPTTQRYNQWDSSNYQGAEKDPMAGSGGSDHPDLYLVDKNGNGVLLKIKVDFFLNTSCARVTVDGTNYPGGTLQVYHEKIGKTRDAYFDKNGKYKAGWINTMNIYISSAVVNNLTPEVRKYDAEAMWKDDTLRTDLQSQLQSKLQGLVNEGMETDLEFYKDFKVTITSITPDPEFLALYKERQNAKIRAETAEANKAARVTEADANAQVAKREALVRQAEISGYGSVDAYLRYLAIQKGINPWQPTVSSVLSK